MTDSARLSEPVLEGFDLPAEALILGAEPGELVLGGLELGLYDPALGLGDLLIDLDDLLTVGEEPPSCGRIEEP